MKHVVAWLIVLIIIVCALLHGPDAEGAELIIVHPDNQEVLQGSVIELHSGFMDFHVDSYDSYAFDTINSDGFEPLYGANPRNWNIVLEFDPLDVYFFTYFCGHYVSPDGQQIVLYCAN